MKKSTEKKTVNTQEIINCYRAAEKAYGALKKSVEAAFKGCKTLAQYTKRRELVYADIDSRVLDKKEATKIKAKVNNTLSGNRKNRIMPEGMHFPNPKGGRSPRVQQAEAVENTAQAPTAKKAAQTVAVLHDMASGMSVIRNILEDKRLSKNDQKSRAERLINFIKSIVN